MNVKIEKLEKNTVQLEITVDAATFEAGLVKSYIKNVKKYNVPGFRKGKAPRKMIERMYGDTVFVEDAVEDIVPTAFTAAVEDNGIEAVDRPDYDLVTANPGEDLVFTAKVIVKPEVELGVYTKLGVEKDAVIVTEDEVEAELNTVAERNSRMTTIEDRPVQNGDIAIIDFEGSIDGVLFDGGAGDNHSLTIGSGSFIPGFEEQLIGAETGSEVNVNVTFPEDYGKDDLAGKLAVFKCKINEIKNKELPEMDDEFAMDVSEFDTLEEYKQDIRAKLVLKKEDQATKEFENAVIDKIVQNCTIDLPRAMIERRIDNLLYDMDMRLRYQGMELAKYMEYMGLTEPEMRIQFSDKAEKEVRGQLCLEKIGEVEGFEATEEEIEAEIVKVAAQYNQSVEDLKKQLQDGGDLEFFKKDVILKKTLEFVVANA